MIGLKAFKKHQTLLRRNENISRSLAAAALEIFEHINKPPAEMVEAAAKLRDVLKSTAVRQ